MLRAAYRTNYIRQTPAPLPRPRRVQRRQIKPVDAPDARPRPAGGAAKKSRRIHKYTNMAEPDGRSAHESGSARCGGPGGPRPNAGRGPMAMGGRSTRSDSLMYDEYDDPARFLHGTTWCIDMGCGCAYDRWAAAGGGCGIARIGAGMSTIFSSMFASWTCVDDRRRNLRSSPSRLFRRNRSESESRVRAGARALPCSPDAALLSACEELVVIKPGITVAKSVLSAGSDAAMIPRAPSSWPQMAGWYASPTAAVLIAAPASHRH